MLTGSELTTVLTIMGALALGAMVPGPSFVLVARTAASHGRGPGLRVACGLGLGAAVFGAAALLGLVSLMVRAAWLGRAVRVAGGLYLVWLAIRLWRSSPGLPDGPGATTGRPLLSGLSTQLANPKTAVVYAGVFAALLPDRVSPGCAVAVVAGVLVVELGWYALVASLLSTGRARTAYGAAARWVDRGAAAVIGLVGARLVAARS
ncbi:MAG TPA: LysE family transporter [Nocardioides sp.]|nr:LysE family transporter [Nocardioides sp.]